MGKRSGEVGAGLLGTCTPVAAAADFMLPLLGRAAAGGRDVRGNKHASEFGASKQTEKNRKVLS